MKFVSIWREAELQFDSDMQRKFYIVEIFFFGVVDHCQNNLRLGHYLLLPGIAPELKNSADNSALLAKAT